VRQLRSKVLEHTLLSLELYSRLCICSKLFDCLAMFVGQSSKPPEPGANFTIKGKRHPLSKKEGASSFKQKRTTDNYL